MRMDELADALRAEDHIAIVAHVSPDGDALGSALLVRSALGKLGKRAVVLCQDEPPRMYAFVPDIMTVVAPGHLPFAPQCVLFVDVASQDRAGLAYDVTQGATCRLLLDHHATNAGFDGIAVIRPDASSTGEVALELVDRLGVALDAQMAIQLYVAVATDTGNFSFNSTTTQAFQAAARCLEAGLDIGECSRRLFRSRSVPRTRLLGAGLSRMQITAGGRIAYTVLPTDLFDEYDARHEDTEGLVNYLVEMEGVVAGFMAEERSDCVKVSLRSNGQVDVAQIAGGLGGGGHECAAGATLNLPVQGAVSRVLDALRRALGDG